MSPAAEPLGSSRIAQCIPDESGVLAHCQRVAYFARMMSDRYEVALDRQRQIEDAAVCHHSFPFNLGSEGLRRLEEDLKISFSPGEIVEAEAPNIAPELLEACNCLDESVEFAPFDGLSIVQALDCFGLPGDPVFYQLLGLALHHCPERFDGRAEVQNLDRLPVLPRAAKRLLSLDKEAAGVSEVESIAKSDPVLAANLISRANSARYARLSEAKCIRDAIVYLGVPASCTALLAASFHALFASANLRKLWEHATMAAEMAENIAIAAGGIEPEEAYLAGLVHDIGRLVVEKFPQAARVLEAELQENGFPVAYAESIAYRIDHTQLGAELLRRWNFPDSLVEAVRFHHRPEASDSRLAALLYLTEQLCESGDQGAFEDLPSILRRGKATGCVGLTLAQMSEMGTRRESVRIAG